MTAKAELPAAELASLGYRRVSRAYGLVARVDREDWLEVLAEALHRPVASLKAAQWADFYRRVHSKDVLQLPASKALEVPTSDNDGTGYVATQGAQR